MNKPQDEYNNNKIIITEQNRTTIELRYIEH